MRALSIRQPYAELILRGIKTVEYRTIATTITDERFYIYAPLKAARADLKVWSRDLREARDLPDWMIELAQQVGMIEPGALLPTGVIVGTAVIEKCTEVRSQSSEVSLNSELRTPTSLYQWHLTDIKRLLRPRKPRKHPQPVWFNPFD